MIRNADVVELADTRARGVRRITCDAGSTPAVGTNIDSQQENGINEHRGNDEDRQPEVMDLGC